MSNSVFHIHNEELEKIIQVLLLIGVEQQNISDLISIAYSNTSKNWEEEVFYILKQRVEQDASFIEGQSIGSLTEPISSIWKSALELDFEEKMTYLLTHFLNWENNKIANLLDKSVSQVEEVLILIITKLE